MTRRIYYEAKKIKTSKAFFGNAHRNCDDCCFGKDCLSESLLSIPKVITYTDNDTIKLGNYEIKQTGWEWGDGSLLKEKCPDYAYDQTDDGSEYPFDSVRVGFITLSVTKVRTIQYHLILQALHLKWEPMVISMTWNCFLH